MTSLHLHINDIGSLRAGDVVPTDRETALLGPLAVLAGRERALLLLRTVGANGLLHLDAGELASSGDIGTELAEQIVASRDLGLLLMEQPPRSASSQERLEALLPKGYARLEREVLLGVAMTGAFRVKAIVVLSTGGMAGTCTLPSDVFCPLLRHGAQAFALIHNHPSGDPTPSQDDVVMTTAVARCAELLGLQLVDHLVVGTGGVVSFASTGLLPTRSERRGLGG